jgi:hypothetical protein
MAVNIIRKFLMKKLMKPNAEGIMKIPEKGRIDFSEHFIKERLFTNGIDEKLIKNERQLENILQSIDQAEARKLKQEADRLGLNDPKKNKFMKEGEVIEVDFDKGRWNKAGGGLAKKLIQEIIRKYKGRVDDRLLNQMLADDNPQRLAEVMATVDEALIMQQKGMKPNQIVETVKESFKRKKQAQGGRTGLSYLLAEDTNERVPLAGGGSGKPPINFYVDFSGSGGKEGQNIYGIEGLNQKGYDYGGTFAADTTFPFFGGELSVGGELGIGRNKRDVDYKGQPIDFLSGVGETKLGDDWNVGMKWRKKFAAGGMGRRAFLKLMAALGLTGAAAKYGLPTLFQKATPKVAKELTQVPIKNIEGMPAWFKPLVNKVIKEGEDVTKQWAYKDRQIVHTTKLPDSQTDVLVTQDLDSGDVLVDIGLEKHGFASGKFGQPVRLEYKAAEVIEPDLKTGKGGMKTKEEFYVEEAEFTGGHPENVKFEESTINKFGEHESNFDEVEMFAKGKTKKGSRNVSESFDKMNEDIADRFANYPDPDDYADGGIAKMLGE